MTCNPKDQGYLDLVETYKYVFSFGKKVVILKKMTLETLLTVAQLQQSTETYASMAVSPMLNIQSFAELGNCIQCNLECFCWCGEHPEVSKMTYLYPRAS